MESKDEYFFDSYAIISLLNQCEEYLAYANSKIITNALCIGEVYNYFLREHGKETAEYWVKNLKCDILPITKEIAVEASSFKFTNRKKKFSYTDCIGYISSINAGLIFLTGDKEFEELNNVEFVK